MLEWIQELQQELSEGKVDPRIIQEKMAAKPKYNSSHWKKAKYTKDLDEYLDKY